MFRFPAGKPRTTFGVALHVLPPNKAGTQESTEICMASRRGDTFDKRQRERRRQEKNADKRAKRQGTENPNGPLVATQTQEKPPDTSMDTLIEDFTPKTSEHRKLLEKFHMIKEHKKAGGIDNDTFELLRMEIFEDLGLEP